jgi:hypothetical protein
VCLNYEFFSAFQALRKRGIEFKSLKAKSVSACLADRLLRWACNLQRNVHNVNIHVNVHILRIRALEATW